MWLQECSQLIIMIQVLAIVAEERLAACSFAQLIRPADATLGGLPDPAEAALYLH
jgi:hypothetical protein